MMTREKWDILWELMEASTAMGVEAEKLYTQPTIENYQKAYDRRIKALAHALDRLDVIQN